MHRTIELVAEIKADSSDEVGNRDRTSAIVDISEKLPGYHKATRALELLFKIDPGMEIKVTVQATIALDDDLIFVHFLVFKNGVVVGRSGAWVPYRQTGSLAVIVDPMSLYVDAYVTYRDEREANELNI